MKARKISILMTLVLIMSACNNPLSDLLNPTAPSTSSSVTDTFNGTLTPKGSLVFTFVVGSSGSVAVTLTGVTPATSGPLGLGVGPSTNGSCTIANSTSAAVAGTSAQLTATENAGNYCVQVTDAGTLTTASAVTVTVAHP